MIPDHPGCNELRMNLVLLSPCRWQQWIHDVLRSASSQRSQVGKRQTCGRHPSRLCTKLHVSLEICRSWFQESIYCKASNISCTLVHNKIVDHSDVVGASPVGAAPNTSSFSTWHLASRDSAKKAARQYENLLSVGFGAVYIKDLMVDSKKLAWLWNEVQTSLQTKLI